MEIIPKLPILINPVYIAHSLNTVVVFYNHIIPVTGKFSALNSIASSAVITTTTTTTIR